MTINEPTPDITGANEASLPVSPPPVETPPQAEPEPKPALGADDPLPPSEGEAVDGEQPSSPATPTEPVEPDIDYSDWHSTGMKNESYRNADEARHEETRRKEQSRLQPLLQGAKEAAQEYTQSVQQAMAHSGEIIRLGQKLEKDGIVDEGTFANALVKHAPEFARLMTGLERTKAYFDGMDFSLLVLAEELGDPALANSPRRNLQGLQAKRFSEAEVKLIAQDGMKDLMKVYGKKEREAGLREGLKQAQKATGAATAAAGAGGTGPDMTTAVGSGGRSAAELLRDIDWVSKAPIADLRRAKEQAGT